MPPARPIPTALVVCALTALPGLFGCSGCHGGDEGSTGDAQAPTTASASPDAEAASLLAVVKATTIGAPAAPPPGAGPAVTLTKTQETKVDRLRTERIDPAPRIRLQRAQIGELHRQFERARRAGGPEAIARSWREYLTKETAPATQPMIQVLFGTDGSDVLGAYESRYGAALWAEQFHVQGGDAVLVVLDAPSKAAKVGRFDEHQRYTVVRFDLHGEGGPAPSVAGAVDLDALYPGVLEMQDARVGEGGTVFVNAVHPGPTSDVAGNTGYLAAVDIIAGKLLFQTGPGVSRGEIAADGDLVFTTFAAKSESSELIVSDAKTGAKLGSAPLPGAALGLRVVEHRVHVGTPAVDLDFDAKR